MKHGLLLLFVLSAIGCRAQGNSPRETIVVTNAQVPWELAYGPDNCIWWTERAGSIFKMDPADGIKTKIGTIAEVQTNGEGGLMGLVFHPNFAINGQIYVSYTYGSTLVRVARYTISGNQLTAPQTIIDGIAGNSYHDGCRLAIGPDQKLYIATGDAGDVSLPQKDGSLNGRILRLNLDGTIPADNPSPSSAEWARGLRNSQGLVWVGDKLYGSEHGPNTDDELNLLEAGRNYGWPDVKGYCDLPDEKTACANLNVREPLKAWTPTIAPAGMDYYPADGPISQWRGCLLMTSLKQKTLYAMKLSADGLSIISTTEYFVGTYGRLRDVAISPSGDVYLSTSNRDGRGSPISTDDRIIKFSPAGTGIQTKGTGALRVLPTPDGWRISTQATETISLFGMDGTLQWQGPASGEQSEVSKNGLPAGLYLLTAQGSGILRRAVVSVR